MMSVLRLVGVFLAARPLGSVSWRIAVSATGSKPLERWLSPAGGYRRSRGFTFHLAPSWVRTPLAPPRVVLDYRDLTAPEARSFPFPTHGCCCGRHCWGHCSHSARLSSSQSPPPWMGSGRGSLRGGGGSVSWEAPPLLSLSRCRLWLTQRAKMIKGGLITRVIKKMLNEKMPREPMTV